MIKATLAKEISIETPNDTGIAAKVTNLVANQAKANIRSAWAAGTNGQGHFGLITDNNQKALEALKKDYPKAKEHEVLVLGVKDTIGAIAQVTTAIGNANINIDYLYTTSYDNAPALVLSTNDNKKALTLFNK